MANKDNGVSTEAKIFIGIAIIFCLLFALNSKKYGTDEQIKRAFSANYWETGQW